MQSRSRGRRRSFHLVLVASVVSRWARRARTLTSERRGRRQEVPGCTPRLRRKKYMATMRLGTSSSVRLSPSHVTPGGGCVVPIRVGSVEALALRGCRARPAPYVGRPRFSPCFRQGERERVSDYRDPQRVQNPSVEAPFTIASTTMAAVTILAPGMRCSSVMPRGFAHAPQAQICPPFTRNESTISLSG